MKGWKTLLIGAGIAALGAIQQSDIAKIISPEYVGLAMSAVGGLMMVLRFFTDTPVGKDTPK